MWRLRSGDTPGRMFKPAPPPRYAVRVTHPVRPRRICCDATRTDADALHFGLAAGCLKHSLPGDFSTLGVADVEGFLAQAGFDVRR